MERVTRKELKELAPGETRQFKLPDAAACNNAHTTIWAVRKLTGWDLVASTDYAACTVSVTRNT